MNGVAISLLVSVAFAAGTILLLGNPVTWIAALVKHRRPSFFAAVKTRRGDRKPFFLVQEFEETQAILQRTYRSNQYRRCLHLSAIFAVAGAAVGLLIKNPFLVAVLALAGVLVPPFAVRLTATSIMRHLAGEVHTTLSVITTNYLRRSDFVGAVQDNIVYFSEPIKGVWQTFLDRYNSNGADISDAVRYIRNMVDDEIWQEWCDGVLLCLEDPTRKHILPLIIHKAVQRSQIQDELDLSLQKPFTETMGVMAIVIFAAVACGSIIPDWGDTLLHDTGGQACIGVIAAACLFAIYKAVHAARPVSMGRLVA